jgi:hypothetical protein
LPVLQSSVSYLRGLLRVLALALAAGAPESEEIHGDGKTKQEAADCVKPISLKLPGGMNEDR